MCKNIAISSKNKQTADMALTITPYLCRIKISFHTITVVHHYNAVLRVHNLSTKDYVCLFVCLFVCLVNWAMVVCNSVQLQTMKMCSNYFKKLYPSMEDFMPFCVKMLCHRFCESGSKVWPCFIRLCLIVDRSIMGAYCPSIIMRFLSASPVNLNSL